MKSAKEILSEQLDYDHINIEDFSDRQVSSILTAMKIFATMAVDEVNIEIKKIDLLLNDPDALGEYLAGI